MIPLSLFDDEVPLDERECIVGRYAPMPCLRVTEPSQKKRKWQTNFSLNIKA